MISPAEFARLMKVSRPAISKAIRVGRVPVYDEAGSRVPGDSAGRKFIKPDEARPAFQLSRARIDDAALAAAQAELDSELSTDPEAPAPAAPADSLAADRKPGSLVDAKNESEQVKAELLRMRLARERGELIDRAAQIAAFETAGGKIARMLNGVQFWAEDLTAVAHKGGVPAVSAWLRDKSSDFLTRLADLLTTPDDVSADDDPPGPQPLPPRGA